MSVIAPPKPPRQEDLEALIREARRRARRRRLLWAAALVAGVVIGAGIYAVVAFTNGGRHAGSVPEGFHLVRAQGPVEHVRIEQYITPSGPIVIDLASGRSHRVPLVIEGWWDRRSGLERTRLTTDGRVQADTVGQACQPKPRFCFPLPLPFDPDEKGASWPPRKKSFRVLGRGTFHGRNVIWVKSLSTFLYLLRGDRLAYDSRTHELVGRRSGGRVSGVDDEVFSRERDLPAAAVSFRVPEGGAALHSFPPAPQSDTRSHATTLSAVRTALGIQPLWVGPSFRGERLQSVEVGTEAMQARDGARLRPARFVTFDYGSVKLREFGHERPFWYEQGPRAGRLVIDAYSRAALVRGGLLVLAERDRMDRSAALAIAGALRPLPSG